MKVSKLFYALTLTLYGIGGTPVFCLMQTIYNTDIMSIVLIDSYVFFRFGAGIHGEF